MKNIITLSLCVTAILDLWVVASTSFSQKVISPQKAKMTTQQKSAVDSSVILEDPRFQKFIADTTEFSKRFEQKVDCVRIEHSITKQRLEGDKELIKVQKTNFNGLYELKGLTSHGLEVLDKLLSEDIKKLPEVNDKEQLENKKPNQMSVALTPPDTVPIPVQKKSFFHKIFRFLK